MDGDVREKNLAPLWGLLLALAALFCNALFFFNPPARQALPWLSIALAALALIFVVRGLMRAFGKRRLYRGKILGPVLGVISLLLVGMVGFISFHARALPKSAGAPQVGDKALDFTLPNTNGHPVSLSDLFAPAADGTQTKAVLLVFYRGYW